MIGGVLTASSRSSSSSIAAKLTSSHRVLSLFGVSPLRLPELAPFKEAPINARFRTPERSLSESVVKAYRASRRGALVSRKRAPALPQLAKTMTYSLESRASRLSSGCRGVTILGRARTFGLADDHRILFRVPLFGSPSRARDPDRLDRQPDHAASRACSASVDRNDPSAEAAASARALASDRGSLEFGPSVRDQEAFRSDKRVFQALPERTGALGPRLGKAPDRLVAAFIIGPLPSDLHRGRTSRPCA